MKRLTDREILRQMTRLELNQAHTIMYNVQSNCHDKTPDEVAKTMGMPKTLVRQLNVGTTGYLYDCILWMRRQEDPQDPPESTQRARHDI